MKYPVYEEIFWAIMRNDSRAIKDLDQKHGHTELIQGSIRICETKRANMLGYLLIDALSEEEIQRLLITPDEERHEIDKRLLSTPLDLKLKEESLPNPDEIRQKTNTVLRNVKAEKWTEFFKREMPYDFAELQQNNTLSQEFIEKMIGDKKLSQKMCNTIAGTLIHELIEAYQSKKKEIKPLLEITEKKMHEKVFDSLASSLSTELQHSFFGSSLGTPNKFLMEIVLSQYVKENPREMHESGKYITDIEQSLSDWQKELIIVFTSKSALTESAVRKIFHLPSSSIENLFVFVIEGLIKKAMLSLNELKPLWNKKLELAELEIDRQTALCLKNNEINETGLPSNVLHGLLETHQKKIHGFDSKIEKVKREMKDLKMLCFEQYKSEYSNLSPEVEQIVQAKKAYQEIIEEWAYFSSRQVIQIPKKTDDPSEVKPFVDALNAFTEEHPEKNFDKYNNLDYRVKTISRAIKRIALRKFFEQNFELLKSCFAEDGASFQKTLENLVKAPMRELLEKHPNIDALPDQIKEKIIDQLTNQPLSINALTYINALLILNLGETVAEQNDRLEKIHQFHSNKSNETHGKFYCFHNLTAEILQIVTTENRETLNQRFRIR